MGFSGVYFTLFLDAAENVIGTSSFDGDDFPINFGALGEVFAPLGDLDGDGVPDLAVGFPFEGVTGAPAPNTRGAVSLTSLKPDGSIAKHLMLAHQLNGVGDLPTSSAFGSALAALGDLDGDGGPELAVGALNDGPNDRGAVWLLALDGRPVRNGSGANPLTLTELAQPVLGAPWSLALDCSAHASGFALVAGSDRPLPGLHLPAGELLADASLAHRLFTLLAPHTGAPAAFAPPIPNDLALLDLRIFSQGLCTGAPGARLSNALDVVIGR